MVGTSPNGSALSNSAALATNATIGATASAAAGIQWGDIVNLTSSVDPAFGSADNASFVTSYGVFNYLLAQKNSTGSRLYPELAERKLGPFPIIISAALPQTITSGNVVLLFGDFAAGIGLTYSGLGLSVLRETRIEFNQTEVVFSSRVASAILLSGAVKALKLTA